MLKLINITFFILTTLTLYGQESLMLGEYRIEDIKEDRDTLNVERVSIYARKFKKKGKAKNEVLKGFLDYSSSGYLLEKTFYGGKKDQNKYLKRYKYDGAGNIIEYDNIIFSGGAINNSRANFSYNNQNQLVEQEITLANIRYAYYPDGRLKSKSYYYNNRGESDTKPWVILFEYDEDNNMIHADTDTTGNTQTSFYNEKGELIRHDYYPGVAYSTYSYDSLGQCIQQTDYEMGKKDWDSTVYVYSYDNNGRLIKTGSSKKRGKISTDREWIFNDKGQLTQEIIYRKGKKKWIYEYRYEYYPFKE